MSDTREEDVNAPYLITNGTYYVLNAKLTGEFTLTSIARLAHHYKSEWAARKMLRIVRRGAPSLNLTVKPV